MLERIYMLHARAQSGKDTCAAIMKEEYEKRGKRVITTDGAPAWGDGNTYGGRLVYLKGYLNGSREERIS